MRRGAIILLSLLLLGSFLPSCAHAQDTPWWNADWTYRQDLTLPLSLSTPGLAGQPIDLRLTLQHPCWTTDDNHTSIRVIRTHNDQTTELESEISNLTYANTNQLQSCRLVFILPTDLTSTDTFQAYYDDNPTPSPNYPDHITITTGHLYLEPVSGYAMTADYYAINDDTKPIYTICYQGTFLFYSSTHYVSKLAPNATTPLPSTTDIIANFEFKYYYGDPVDQFQTTANHPVSRHILHDGTLSTTIQITSASQDNTLHTTATYTYYHTTTPTQTRLRIHTDHTTTSACQITPGASTDGTLAQLQCGGIQCTTMPDLSISHLYPYIHLHTTTGTQEYPLDPTPDYTNDPVTRLFSPTDNIDLTTPAWTSVDEGTNGTAHALIFASTHILKNGTDEHDGIQVNGYESNTPNLPGFHNTLGVLQCNRNSVDTTGTQDLTIPADYHAACDTEFYTSNTGGYPAVTTEAAIFPTLASLLPATTLNTTTPQTPPEHRYTLTVQIHHAPSMPFGEALSILRGHNYSYITTEVYQGTTRLASVPAVHIPFKTTDTTNISIRDILDLTNSTLIKTSTLPALPSGTYLIKIIRSHPHHSSRIQYLGYAVVNLTKNTTLKIHCSRQATTTIQLQDQKGNGIPDADVALSMASQPIAWGQTAQDGTLRLTAPRQTLAYSALILYKGFLIANHTLRFPLLGSLPRSETIRINLSDVTLNIQDTWGLPPDISLSPLLTSPMMNQIQNLSMVQTTPGQYQIKNLPTAPYTLQVRYQTFSADATIPMKETTAQMVFPAEYPIRFRSLDARGLPLQGLSLHLQRQSRTLDLNTSTNNITVKLPPGTYQLEARTSSGIIGKRSLQVTGPREVTIVSDQDPVSPGFLLGGITVMGVMSFFGLRRRDWALLLAGGGIAVIIASFWFPWWEITGSTTQTTIASRLFVMPTSLISFVQTPTVLSGELASLPGLFYTAMFAVLAGTILGCSLLLLSLYERQKGRRRAMWGLWIVSLGGLIGSLALVLASLSILSQASTGSLMGSGAFQTTIPGVGTQSIPASWGPAPGFWLFCLGLLLLGPVVCLLIKKRKNKNEP